MLNQLRTSQLFIETNSEECQELKTFLFIDSHIPLFCFSFSSWCLRFLASRTNGRRAYALVLRPSVICLSVVCNVYIVAKRCVLPKNSLKKQIEMAYGESRDRTSRDPNSRLRRNRAKARSQNVELLLMNYYYYYYYY